MADIMKTYTDIPGWYDWHNTMKRLVMKFFPVNGIYLEVGVWKGKSLVAFAHEANRLGRKPVLIGIDTFGGKQDDAMMDNLVTNSGGDFLPETRQNLREANVDAELIRNDSQRQAPLIDDESIDFILIDALHSYEAVKADTQAYWPKLKKGGVMLWHDVDRPEVAKAVTDAIGHDWHREKPRIGYARKK